MNNQRFRSLIIPPFLLGVLVLSLLLSPVLFNNCLAGQLSVYPIRLFLDKSSKTGVINLINRGEDKAVVQANLSEWTQDEDGKDVYTDSKDLIYYPKLVTLEAGEKKALRVGIQGPPTGKEKTYRLFIQELPSRDKKKEDGVTVSVSIRFGVPIFVAPLNVEEGVEIKEVRLKNGTLEMLMANTGNSFFMIDAVHVKGLDGDGKEMFTEELKGWYLLSGASRRYTVAIPGKVCSSLSRLDVGVKMDSGKKSLDHGIDVNRKMCAP